MNEQEKKAKATKAADPALAANEEGAQDAAQQAVVEGAAELALPELPAELTELAAALREFGGVGALMDAVRGIKANSDRQKAQIVGRLAANSRCAFSKAELEAMGLDSLVKLEASIAPVGQTYVGRNGANVAANVDGGLRAYKGAAKQADAAQAEVKQ